MMHLMITMANLLQSDEVLFQKGINSWQNLQNNKKLDGIVLWAWCTSLNYYAVANTSRLLLLRVVAKKVFLLFSQQPFGILIWNFTVFLKCSMANCQVKYDSIKKWQIFHH